MIRLWKCIKWSIIVNSLKTTIVFYEIISNDNGVTQSAYQEPEGKVNQH